MAISGPHLPPQLLQTVPSHHLNVPCGVVILKEGREGGREGERKEGGREGGREKEREKEREGGQDTYQSLLQASCHHGDTEAP